MVRRIEKSLAEQSLVEQAEARASLASAQSSLASGGVAGSSARLSSLGAVYTSADGEMIEQHFSMRVLSKKRVAAVQMQSRRCALVGLSCGFGLAHSRRVLAAPLAPRSARLAKPGPGTHAPRLEPGLASPLLTLSSAHPHLCSPSPLLTLTSALRRRRTCWCSTTTCYRARGTCSSSCT